MFHSAGSDRPWSASPWCQRSVQRGTSLLHRRNRPTLWVDTEWTSKHRTTPIESVDQHTCGMLTDDSEPSVYYTALASQSRSCRASTYPASEVWPTHSPLTLSHSPISAQHGNSFPQIYRCSMKSSAFSASSSDQSSPFSPFPTSFVASSWARQATSPASLRQLPRTFILRLADPSPRLQSPLHWPACPLADEVDWFAALDATTGANPAGYSTLMHTAMHLFAANPLNYFGGVARAAPGSPAGLDADLQSDPDVGRPFVSEPAVDSPRAGSAIPSPVYSTSGIYSDELGSPLYTPARVILRLLGLFDSGNAARTHGDQERQGCVQIILANPTTDSFFNAPLSTFFPEHRTAKPPATVQVSLRDTDSAAVSIGPNPSLYFVGSNSDLDSEHSLSLLSMLAIESPLVSPPVSDARHASPVFEFLCYGRGFQQVFYPHWRSSLKRGYAWERSLFGTTWEKWLRDGEDVPACRSKFYLLDGTEREYRDTEVHDEGEVSPKSWGST